MIGTAIIFDNFGPYHLARLRAAAQVCDLTAIEVGGVSAVYAWENGSFVEGFKRVTLVEKSSSDGVSRADLYQRLERALGECKPRVVVIPGWASPAAWGAMRWCLRNGVPMICMSESTEQDERRTAWKEWVKRKLISLFSGALVGGERHRDYLVKLGMLPDRIFLGYDAVDNNYFREKSAAFRSDEKKTRREFVLPQKYLLASARFVEKKNLPRLLEAYGLYHDRSEDPYSLVLLGDGALRSDLEKKRDSLGLQELVLMPGFKQIDDLPAYYAMARAFIHPSTVEPWGLVVNEAMASALPVLVSRQCGCSPELVNEGSNGFTFDAFNVNEMAESMARVAAPDFTASTFGQTSSEIVAAWGPQRFAEGLSATVTAALAGPMQIPGPIARLLLRILKSQ